MAFFDIDFPEDYMSKFLKADSEELCLEMLNGASQILEDEMKATLRADGHELSGELIDSIKATKAKRASNGAYIVNVRPTGYSAVNSYSVKGKGDKTRKYPVSNALKMIWIEYGVNGRQPARPFLASVVNKTRERALKRMQEIYNRKVGAE